GLAVEAERSFDLALAVARRQQARSLELRAATSLFRLRRGQGRAVEARDLLAGIYASFTQGFDTADLRGAKELLGSTLESTSPLRRAAGALACTSVTQGGRQMAKGGFKVMDSDIHVDEPHDLWDRYLEPRFRDRAPRFAAIDGSHMNGWQFEGKVFPAF